ncbi:uncharacterized protein LOC119280999 [Triticum dicoccoides]|uniref:uncharacterized protein LOC119280999 n=1 Tax=Triticum dicoccoides TaxID=85692 RepID=UPI0018904FB9|nr:uncharacterized protein LOC119280999 [Triticum dicoccoides]
MQAENGCSGDALRKATKFLEDRLDRNPVTPVMLMSDTQQQSSRKRDGDNALDAGEDPRPTTRRFGRPLRPSRSTHWSPALPRSTPCVRKVTRRPGQRVMQEVPHLVYDGGNTDGELEVPRGDQLTEGVPRGVPQERVGVGRGRCRR